MSYYQSKRAPTYGRAKFSSKPRSAGRGPKKAYINPSRFVQSARSSEAPEYITKNAFADFDVNPLIHKNLETKGYTQPSPIQDQTIPVGLSGKDVVGIANTGTGKTAAFAIPVIHQLMTHRDKYALILAPTRELAIQIEDQIKKIAKGSGLHGAVLIGGTAMGPQLRDLRDNPRIVIGTPGRVKDHLERKTLRLSQFNIVVLDEVDRMLDMGFINDIRHILGRMAEKRQSFFFSATLDSRVKTIIDSFSHDPVHIEIKTGDTSDNVEQNVVTYVSKEEKIDKLHNLLISEAVGKTLVFDDTQRSVERLSKELEARGFQVDAIHGGKSQNQRQRALSKFRENKVNVLVATDVAARGIDVADITHVINYSTPGSYSDYVHRIGRAGRAGRLGYALTFIEK